MDTSSASAAAVSMFSGLPDPPGVFYEALLAVHSTTGLGWAGTFVLSTVLMRAGMLPLSVFSDRNSRKVRAPEPLPRGVSRRPPRATLPSALSPGACSLGAGTLADAYPQLCVYTVTVC